MPDRMSPQQLRDQHTFTAAPPRRHVPRIMPLVIGIVAALAIGALAYVALETFLAQPPASVEPLPMSSQGTPDESRIG